MAATKLSIANGALRLMKEGALTQNELNTGAREPGRLFNAVWADGGVDACLRAAEWRFARRSVKIDFDAGIVPGFGFTYAFAKPDDLVRVCGVWSDATMLDPLMDVREEAGYWYANLEAIYVTYVSNHVGYGLNFGLWPQDFLKFVHAHFASEMVGPLTSASKDAIKLRQDFLNIARGVDGQADPPRRQPHGSWVHARSGGYSGYRSRENG